MSEYYRAVILFVASNLPRSYNYPCHVNFAWAMGDPDTVLALQGKKTIKVSGIPDSYQIVRGDKILAKVMSDGRLLYTRSVWREEDDKKVLAEITIAMPQ